jgi:hypothetical protein
MKLRTYRTAVLAMFASVWLVVGAIGIAVMGVIPAGWAFLVATVLFVAVFIVTTLFALAVNLKLLRITCPLCSRPGRLATVMRRYTYFICPQCGEVHPSGPFSRSYVQIDAGLSEEEGGQEDVPPPPDRPGEDGQEAS